MLLRENSRKFNSLVIFSDDEGETWTKPRELPGSLTGDRQSARYAPDGRLFISLPRHDAREPDEGRLGRAGSAPTTTSSRAARASTACD